MAKNNLKISKGFLYLVAGGLATFILSNCNVTVQTNDKNVYMINENNNDDEINNRKLKKRGNENTHSFYFKNYHITEDIINLNDISPNTEEIVFMNCQIDNLDFISSLNNLNNITFQECKIENLSSISELENLKIITFIDCEIEDKQFNNLNNSIENIAVYNCSTDKFKSICDLTNLKYLTISIKDEFDYTLFSKINSNLEELTIMDSANTSKSFDFGNISNLKSLKTLQLKTNKNVENIDSIKNMTSLNTLIISEYNYENLEFIKSIPNLEILYLSVASHDLENGLVDISPIVELNNERKDDNKLGFHGYVVTGKNSFINYSLEELQELISNNGKQLKKSKN